MKKALFISISISLLFLSLCQQKAEEETGEDVNILKYKVVKKVRYRSWNTMVYRIILEVAEFPTEDQMKETAIHIWENGNKNWNTFSVFMYLPGMNVKRTGYGRGQFNANGMEYFTIQDSSLNGTRWEELLPKDIEAITFRSKKRIKEGPVRLSLEKRKQIYLEYTMDLLWKFDDGSDSVPKKLNEKYMRKYNLTKSELTKILFEGAGKHW